MNNNFYVSNTIYQGYKMFKLERRRNCCGKDYNFKVWLISYEDLDLT